MCRYASVTIKSYNKVYHWVKSSVTVIYRSLLHHYLCWLNYLERFISHSPYTPPPFASHHFPFSSLPCSVFCPSFFHLNLVISFLFTSLPFFLPFPSIANFLFLPPPLLYLHTANAPPFHIYWTLMLAVPRMKLAVNPRIFRVSVQTLWNSADNFTYDWVTYLLHVRTHLFQAASNTAPFPVPYIHPDSFLTSALPVLPILT